MAALLTLALVNPDGVIAERNIARYQATGKLDHAYLEDLSADAVPALRALPEQERNGIIGAISAYPRDTDWRCWNLSRFLILQPTQR